MFDPLPRAYLTWNQSEVPVDTFLRYQIFRDGVHIANINARDVTSYEDYTLYPGQLTSYTITQVMDVAGEEVESEPASPQTVTVNCKHLFLHDVNAPTNYVQFAIGQQSVRVLQDIGYIQPALKQRPIAQIGNVDTTELSVPYHDTWDDMGFLWEELRNLISRQRTHGSKFMARQGRDVRMFCVIDSGTSRDDAPVTFATNVLLREIDYVERVS